MTKNKDVERTLTALQAATARAMSDDKDFQPSDQSYVGKGARFQADKDACKHRFHDPLIHGQYQPEDPSQQMLFAALEEERLLSQGYQRFPGVYKHLPRVKTRPDLVQEMVAYLRHKWFHKKGKALTISDNLLPFLDQLVEQRSHQEDFAKLLQHWMEELAPQEDHEEAQEKLEDTPAESQEPDQPASSRTSPMATPSQGKARARSRKIMGEEDPLSPATTPQEPDVTLEDLGYDENYHPYTRRFDRVVRAEFLAEHDERERLKTDFQQALDETDMQHTNRLMTRLRAVLQSQSHSKPQFDQEYGMLHHPRLSRLVTSKNPLVYKQIEDRPFLETTVTLLIDNSGSMRGRPIRLAAISAYLLADTLNKCNVPVEVLGFTTAHWNGGCSRELWNQAGKPPHPGRLNDLLNIIYKDSDTSWRKGRNQFGIMLKEGLLKENIDGEALLWAYRRLQRRNEFRKILIVISDGAPVDDATLAANPGNYLENHLRTTIAAITRNQDVELLAIGIGHDVGQYYPQSVTLDSAEHLGSTLFEELIKLLG